MSKRTKQLDESTAEVLDLELHKSGPWAAVDEIVSEILERASILIAEHSLNEKYTPFGIIHTRDTLWFANSYSRIVQDPKKAPGVLTKEPTASIDVHQKTARISGFASPTVAQKSGPITTSISRRTSEELLLKLQSALEPK